MTPLDLVARHTDTVFTGNYWSSNDEPDLDGDGRSDRPYRLTSVFDHFRGNLTAADLLSDSFAATAIGAAEHAFPVLRLVPVEDPSPLARPPALPGVPAPIHPRGRREPAGMVAVAGPRPRRGRRPSRRGGRRHSMIRYRAFSKRFGAQRAVESLTLDVARGEVVALLGPNGSGKTTTLKAAAGLIRRRRGRSRSATRPGPRPFPTRDAILSYLPQRVSFPDALTGSEVVEFYRELRGAPAERSQQGAPLRLAQRGGRARGREPTRAAWCSGWVSRWPSSRRRPVFLLDEPTAALDPDGLCAFYGLVEHAREDGRAVLFTSHQLGDAERLADRFAVLVGGRLVACLTAAELKDRLSERGRHAPAPRLARGRASRGGAPARAGRAVVRRRARRARTGRRCARASSTPCGPSASRCAG